MKFVKFFLCKLMLLLPLFGEGIYPLLNQIPIEDLYVMREFVDRNFVWDQASHTVFFDNKSCSLCGAFFNPKYRMYDDSIWIRGWETFKKYKQLFRHENFIFSEALDKDEMILNLFIINKQTLKKCIKQHKTTFQSILGKDFNYRTFISKLKHENLLEIIKENQVLLGILLGYGEESARAFEKHSTEHWRYGLISPDIYSGISASISSDCECFPVAFVGNPNSVETKNLCEIYQRELLAFVEKYKRKDPLILFLEGICQKDSEVLPGIAKSMWELPLKFPTYVHQHFLSVF